MFVNHSDQEMILFSAIIIILATVFLPMVLYQMKCQLSTLFTTKIISLDDIKEDKNRIS
jgi:hypothetical protein